MTHFWGTRTFLVGALALGAAPFLAWANLGGPLGWAGAALSGLLTMGLARDLAGAGHGR